MASKPFQCLRTSYMLCRKSRWLLLMLLVCFLAGNVHAQKRGRSSEGAANREERKVQEATFYFTEAVKYYILEDMNKALMLFSKSLESDPDNAAAHFKIAKILMNNGEVDKALLHSSRALELDPENKYYYLTKAEVLTRQSNFRDAAQIYEQMIRKIDKTDEYLFELAALYLYQEDYQKSLNIYDRVEEKFGLAYEIIAQKQKIYLKLNQLDKAIQEGERLIKEFPGEPEFVIALAEMLASNDRGQDAVPHLENLLDIEPDNAEARLMLTKIYQEAGNDQPALDHMKKAFANPQLTLQRKLDLVAKHMQELPDERAEQLCEALTDIILEVHADEAEAYVLKGDFYHAIGKAEEARDYYLESTSYDDSNFEVWQNLLTIEFQNLQETDSVIRHSEEALEMFPNQGILYFYNGAAHAASKNYDEAVYALEQCKQLANNAELNKYCNLYLGDVYNALKNYPKSEAAYEAVLKVEPTNVYVLNNYSYFLALRQQKLEYARKLSTKLLELEPENPNYLDTHAWVLYMMGDYQQAKKLLKASIEKGAGSGEVVEHYGDVLFKLGEVDEAVKQWMKAKGMDDTSDLIDKKIAERKLYE